MGTPESDSLYVYAYLANEADCDYTDVQHCNLLQDMQH